MSKILDRMPPTFRFPPAFRFRPKELELVEFYLLPRARGQDPFPGVLNEDDAAASSLPWDLFERHGLGKEDEAYFLVRTSDAKKPGARQDRSCDGGVGSWKIQSSLEKTLRVGGEKISFRKSNLNLHMGKGKNGGSVGWVMHEYAIAAPPCPSLVKICHIAFTGHGKKRKRVPDYPEDCQIGQASSQRARVDTTAAGGCSGEMMLVPDSGPVVCASADQLLIQDSIFPQQSPVLGSCDFLGIPSAASANAEHYQELEQQVPGTEEQQVPSTEEQQVMMPQLMVEYASADEERSQLALTNDIVPQSPHIDISDHLGFPSAAPANAVQYQELEQQVMTPQLMVDASADEECLQLALTDDDIFRLSPLLDSCDFLVLPSAAPANAGYQELEQQVPSTEEEQVMIPDSSADEECSQSQLVLINNDIFWQSPLLNSSNSLVFPSAAPANAEQGQELEQQVPSIEEEQVIVPQLRDQQSSSMEELEQLNAGELEFWSSIGVDVHSSNFAEQEEFLSSTAVDNNTVVPRISDMAGGQQDQQDFRSLSRADGVQRNCAVPDMATGVLGCTQWGGYCITC